MFVVVFTSFLMSTVSFQTTQSNSKSTNLVDKIRRQLMRDNYDYISSENDDQLIVNRSIHVDIDGKLRNPDDYRSDDADRNNPINEMIIPRAQNDEDGKVQDAAVLDKDLVYYMNDERLEKATAGNIDDYDLSGDLNVTTPKVKYKILKVKNPNRRSMTVQRFIQEEKDDGVAIMNLDDGPLPEFRLPKSRRQYMQDTEDFEDSMSLSELDDQHKENSTID